MFPGSLLQCGVSSTRKQFEILIKQFILDICADTELTPSWLSVPSSTPHELPGESLLSRTEKEKQINKSTEREKMRL